MTLRRRDVLRGGAGLALLGAAPAAATRPLAPLGLADVTVMQPLTRDYAGTLAAVAALGYTHFGFRLAAYAPSATEPTPRDKARMARDAGLQVGVVRFSPKGVDYGAQIAQAAEIGAKIIAMTAAPPFISRRLGVATRLAFEAWLPELAELGRKCRAAGLTFAYHTHWWDFMPVEGGEAPIDAIVRTTAPAEVAIELDLAWCWYGGVAPLAALARLGPRVASMHLKDIDRSRGETITEHAVVIGSGEMGYAGLLPRIRQLSDAIGYIEVDSPPDGLAAAAAGARFFREHGR